MAMLNNIINHSHLFTVHILIVFLLFDSLTNTAAENGSSEGAQPSTIPIGVVLDTNSPMGSMVDLCMKMAVEDFYKKHPSYATRLQLHTRNADTILDANFAGMFYNQKICIYISCLLLLIYLHWLLVQESV